MTGFVRCAVLLVSLAATARAAPPPPPPPAPPPRLLVLPLPPAIGLSADVARMFDARLLVALDDSRRVVTVTEITDLLVEQAVGDWMAAFREARRAKPPAGARGRELGRILDGVERPESGPARPAVTPGVRAAGMPVAHCA